MRQVNIVKVNNSVWFYQSYFIYRNHKGDGRTVWDAYSKFADSKCQDFQFQANNLKELLAAIEFFNEEVASLVQQSA